jgi:hypothetical protein
LRVTPGEEKISLHFHVKSLHLRKPEWKTTKNEEKSEIREKRFRKENEHLLLV